MSLKEQLSEVLKSAMRERNSDKVMVLRGVQAAIKQIEVDTQSELDDAKVLSVLEKQLKQRKESIKAYTEANRPDLAQKEQFEHDVIAVFLPQPLTEQELEALVLSEIQQQAASSIKDMGKVMNALRPQIAGRADGAVVSAMIKRHLS